MSENFLKFKKRFLAFRIIKSAMIGASAGLVFGGALLMLIRLAVLGFAPPTSLFVGLGVALTVGGVVFLLGGRSDKSFAKELDSMFGLDARVQTMVEYGGEQSEMIALQRQDADRALSEIPVKNYKFRRLPVYILALTLSASVLVGGFVVPDMRNYTPPEEIIPFELTEIQEAGILELVRYVEDSDMEEEFSTPIVSELRALLEKLRETDTQNDMIIALTESMAAITSITYESSTATEMLNALWDTDDVYFKHLAKVLDTSAWSLPDWGDFAEKLTRYSATLMGDDDESENAVRGKERLKSALESMTRKLDTVLLSSGVPEDDEMYLAVKLLFSDETLGLELILENIDSLSDDEARVELQKSFEAMSENIYEAISLNKVNATVGEYAMTRLSSLFGVPSPEFERPDFYKNNESVGGGQGSADGDQENQNSPGGVGPGATYGSDDIVLDPLTGQPVKYGDLIDKYNAIMYERLENGSYTEEQKTAIRKYFELLYSGLEKEEGK